MGSAGRSSGGDRGLAEVVVTDAATIAELTLTITQLEMMARRARPAPPPPLVRHALMRAEPPTVSYYRFLYNTVGANWLWTERRIWNDATRQARLTDERTEVYVLYVDGVPAGYGELFQTSTDVTD